MIIINFILEKYTSQILNVIMLLYFGGRLGIRNLNLTILFNYHSIFDFTGIILK